MTSSKPLAALRAEFKVNKREYRTIILLTSLRLTQAAMGSGAHTRICAWPLVAFHRFVSEFILSMELRPRTVVGNGLRIHHGFGLVVNDHAVLGSNVTLRNGVTIGHARPGGGAPRVGNNVDVGVGALIIGDIAVGDGAIIGAGAVVIRDVPEGATVVGNPARVVKLREGE